MSLKFADAVRKRWIAAPARHQAPPSAAAPTPAPAPGDTTAATARPADPTHAASRPGAPLPAWAHPRPRQPLRLRHRPLQPGDEQFLSAVQQAQLAEVAWGTRLGLWLMLASVALALAWAATTRVEQITRAEARVVPEGREQVIASLEGGLLSALEVHEGEVVRAGQLLARLDPTRAAAQQSEGQARRLALRATEARLVAESLGQPLRFPPELDGEAALRATEGEAFGARRRLLDEAVGANARSIQLVGQELAMAEEMSRKGLMSEVEVMRLRRQVIELRQASVERVNRFRQDASTELLRVRADLAQLGEQQVSREDTLRRTDLLSPVDGVVKNIRANTLGGVIGPGAPVMEIVPTGERLRIEARIKPADIGFLRVGQAAEVKLSAYEFNLYGGLHGRIERISPDALGEAERPPGSAEGTWFRALIDVERSTLQAGGRTLEVLPGMTATVEINTGERTVLEYLLRPLLKAREAFRER